MSEPTSQHTVKDPVLGFYRKRHNTPPEKQIRAAGEAPKKAEDPLQSPMGSRGSWTESIMNTLSFGSRSSIASNVDAPETDAPTQPNLNRRASQDAEYEDDISIYGF